MSTVISRTFRSVPYRSAADTWQLIVTLLTSNGNAADRAALESVSGVAASIIADKSPEGSPIIVLGGGPRVRIYCLYDDAALDGEDENEQPLSFNPLDGKWTLSLPCDADDLGWVSEALKKKTSQVTARDASEGLAVAPAKASASPTMDVNVEGFLKP